MDVVLREMSISDYEEARKLWEVIEGIGLTESDTRDATANFLNKNPGFSTVAVDPNGKIIATLICGHDGRSGTLLHLAVAESHRGLGIARQLLDRALDLLRHAGIRRCNVYVYSSNKGGISFWQKNGWIKPDHWFLMQKPILDVE